MKCASIVVALVLSTVVGAQRGSAPRTTTPRTTTPQTTTPQTTTPQTTTHRPSVPPATARPSVPPPITFPLPLIMPPVGGGLTDPVAFRPQARDLFRARQPFNTNPFKSFPYGGGSYFDGYYPESVPPGQVMPPPAIGLLRFDVTPQSAQVFVDSFYAGTIADIEAQRVLTLVAGPHRIELQASGYQPKTFDVRIDPNDTIVYRAALDRERTAATAAARPTGPTRMYVIPGCYAGNMAPRADRLPAGCDIKQVRVIDPPK
jgi:hypothetical protein